MRGNLIDLAVAFILGASFTAVVTAFTSLIMSLISLLGGQPNFDSLTVGGVNIGQFLTAVLSFVILSAILYFGLVKPLDLLKEHASRRKAAEPAPPTTEELLTQIRDLLAKQG